MVDVVSLCVLPPSGGVPEYVHLAVRFDDHSHTETYSINTRC